MSLNNACSDWKGQVYINNQTYPDSDMNGLDITLSEAAIYAINQNKMQVIEIRDLTTTASYCTLPQEIIPLKLF